MKTSRLITLSILTLLLSCGTSTKEKQADSPIKTEADSTQQDSSSTLAVQQKYQDSISLITKRDSLISFLEKPFNFHKFKLLKKGANSGGSSKHNFYYKPEYKGFYYRYFLFPNFSPNVNDGNRKCISYEDGISIKVFKKYGVLQNDYIDSSEVLIDFTSAKNDIDLPEMSFIGMYSEKIIREFGMPTINQDSLIVYSHLNKALILKLQEDFIFKIRYVVLNFNVTDKNLNPELLNF